jgi:hypothetical protein
MIDNSLVLNYLGTFLSFIFPFWPLVVAAQFQWRRHILANMCIAWAGMALVWILTLFGSTRLPSFLIHEPWNTGLFFATGIVLLTLQITRKFWQRRDIQMNADRASSVEDLRRLSPTDFENMVAELYAGMGHKATRTGATGDHGVDLVIQTSNGEKWIVQCKRWRGQVGEPVVRDFYGVMHHEKADQGAVITTGKFTGQARDWAKGKPINLVEGDEFLSLLKASRAKTKAA